MPEWNRLISMKLFLVALLLVGSQSAPVDNVAPSPAPAVSVDLKKPTESSKNVDTNSLSPNMAGPPPDMKPGNSIEHAQETNANKGDVDKRFLLPGHAIGTSFGGYRGLQGTHGTYANFPNVGSYADHVRGYGGFDIGGVGGGLPVNFGLPGAYFG